MSTYIHQNHNIAVYFSNLLCPRSPDTDMLYRIMCLIDVKSRRARGWGYVDEIILLY